MKAALRRTAAASAVALAAALGISACGGGGGSYSGGSPSTPTAPSGPGGTATVTIKAGGTLDPQEIRIDVGQSVRFVNEDTQPRHVQSNPHLEHTECPQTNVPVLNPGQSATTGAYNSQRVCGYHDHLNPEQTRLHGTIRVGSAEGPSGPVYVVHQ